MAGSCPDSERFGGPGCRRLGQRDLALLVVGERLNERRLHGAVEQGAMRKVPSQVVRRLEARLRAHASGDRLGKLRAIAFRTRGPFVYVDAQYPDAQEDFDPLFRLRYLGRDDEWEFAYFTWSRGSRGAYEPSCVSNGMPFGTPEECFDCASLPWRLPLPAAFPW